MSVNILSLGGAGIIPHFVPCHGFTHSAKTNEPYLLRHNFPPFLNALFSGLPKSLALLFQYLRINTVGRHFAL